MKLSKSLFLLFLLAGSLQSPLIAAESQQQSWWQYIQNTFSSLWEKAKANPYTTGIAAGTTATIISAYCGYKLADKFITDYQCKQDVKDLRDNAQKRADVIKTIIYAARTLYLNNYKDPQFNTNDAPENYFNILNKLYGPGKKTAHETKMLEDLMNVSEDNSGRRIFQDNPPRIQLKAMEFYPDETKAAIRSELSGLIEERKASALSEFERTYPFILNRMVEYLSKPFQFKMSDPEYYEIVYGDGKDAPKEFLNLALSDLDSKMNSFQENELLRQVPSDEYQDKKANYLNATQNLYLFTETLKTMLQRKINASYSKLTWENTARDVYANTNRDTEYREAESELEKKTNKPEDVAATKAKLFEIGERHLNEFTGFPKDFPDQYKENYRNKLRPTLQIFIQRDINKAVRK